MKEAFSEFVFVYGTLKEGKSAHKLLKDAIFEGDFAVCGTMYGKNGVAYPMIKFNSMNLVFGEVYSITPDMLKTLDRYEGHPHHYKRERIQLRLPDGQFAEVDEDTWVYEYQGSVEGLDVIESGVF